MTVPSYMAALCCLIMSQAPPSIMIGPGLMLFTRIPWGASACERPFECVIRAAFMAL